MTRSAKLLERVRANQFALLYQCRHSPDHAKALVPELIGLLSDNDRGIQHEALRSLHRIGPAAADAAIHIAPLLRSDDRLTKLIAIPTLGNVTFKNPGQWVPPLVDCADDLDSTVAVLHVLVAFGKASLSASDWLESCLESKSSKVRKLVFRVFGATGLATGHSIRACKRAESDPNAQVREAALKAKARLAIP